MANQRRQKL
ncbi:hypothetical protein VCHC80A1_02348A, partial [Vibrio cholerae HC-80A1]